VKKLILDARTELMRLKETFNKNIYDIRLFDYTPKFINYGVVDELNENISHEANGGYVLVENKFAKLVLKADTDSVRTNVELLHITEHSFYWSGFYKHTDIRYTTEGLLY